MRIIIFFVKTVRDARFIQDVERSTNIDRRGMLDIQDFIELNLFHEIHVSEIREFKKCRRSHHLKYIEQWYPKITATPLTFGTSIHAAKEVYFDPKRWVYDRATSVELAKLEFLRQHDKFVEISKTQLGSQFDGKDDSKFDNLRTLGLGMLDYYFREISPKIDVKILPKFVEKSFATPIFGPQGNITYCKCDKCKKKWDNASYKDEFNGLPVVLEGKIDLILQDVTTQKYWLLDWKTTARIPESHGWLELDEQLSMYVWAMREIGLPVAGFMYHEDWKAYPQEPARLDRPYRGRAFSTDKKQPTTFEIASAVFEEEDNVAFNNGLYDDYLNWLRLEGPKFWNREKIRKTTQELDIIGQQLYEVAMDIIDPQKRMYISPTKYGCQYCDFYNVCVGMQQNADYEYTLKSDFEQKAPYYTDKDYED